MTLTKNSLLIVLIASLLMVLNHPLQAQEGGIEFFHGTWDEVLATAKKERKLVFVDAYTTWCGPCKMMARNTFTDEEVGRFHNKNFVNYKFDMEKGEGPAFAMKYGVRAYPTIYYINYKGEVVHKSVGYKAPDVLLKESREAMDPSKNMANIELDYATGNLEADKLYAYAIKLKKDGEDYKDASQKYFSTLSSKELLSADGWEAIKELSTDVHAPEFQLLLKKQKKFNKIANPAEVDAKIATVFKKNTMYAALANDEQAYRDIMAVAEGQVKDKGKTASRIKMTYAEARKNWDLYARSAIDFFEKYTSTDAAELNQVATLFFKHVDNLEYLAKATNWSRQAMALNNSYSHNDTYACLLYKTGDYQEAFRIANKAISIAQDNHEDYGPTEALLEQIRAKLN